MDIQVTVCCSHELRVDLYLAKEKHLSVDVKSRVGDGKEQ